MPRYFIQQLVLYEFEELDESAQQKALEKGAEILNEDGVCLSDDLACHFGDKASEKGLPIDKIRFSLSCSQGDGVALYGRIDVPKFLKRNRIKTKWRRLFDFNGECRIDMVITGEDNHYHHWNSMSVETSFTFSDHMDWWDKNQAYVKSFEEFVAEFLRDFSKQLEKEGYEIIEDYTSKENVIAFLKANDWLFSKDGKLATIPYNARESMTFGTVPCGLAEKEEKSEQ